ncbi:MAG: NUDIX hydrolase [bacterium]|nr:NUDIX hydrolase [bacterium]
MPVTNGGEVLMVEQCRAGAGERLLELPAGTLGAGEEPESCARRELAEETGYSPGRLELLAAFFLTPGFCSEFMHVFLATDLRSTLARPELDEEIELKRFRPVEALAMARDGRLRDAKSVAGLLLAAYRLGW